MGLYDNAEEVWPQYGGCWFCARNAGKMLFSWEFDTYFHASCLRDKVILLGDYLCQDVETSIIFDEFCDNMEDLDTLIESELS